MSTAPSRSWLHRIQALLAKAESTEFPAEAEALLAKAQELMTRHAVDHAMLAALGRVVDDDIVCQAVTVPGPYAGAKRSLLAHVAVANACRCVRTGRDAADVHCTLVGFATDVAKTTTLFAALSMHGTRTMLGTPVPPHDRPRRFRHAFLLAYGYRIGARLQEAAARARQPQGPSVEGPRSVAVVLAAREDRVDRAFHDAFPATRAARTSASSVAGASAGRSAADRAPLDGAVGGRRRGELEAS